MRGPASEPNLPYFNLAARRSFLLAPLWGLALATLVWCPAAPDPRRREEAAWGGPDRPGPTAFLPHRPPARFQPSAQAATALFQFAISYIYVYCGGRQTGALRMGVCLFELIGSGVMFI